MSWKRLTAAAALIAGILSLGGCEMPGLGSWTPRESTAISIRKDGTIKEIVQETLDAGYYDASELEKMITSEVEEYDARNGEDSVRVEKFSDEDSMVNLTMEYASAADYAEFNNTEFYYGSIIDAQLKGYLFDVSFYQVEDGVAQGEVSGSEVIPYMDKAVLILRAPMEVQVPGDVLFISTNAEVLASDVVDATGAQQEEITELVLPSSGVYRSGEEWDYEQQQSASLVYILFDDTK